MEGDIITLQDIFAFDFEAGLDSQGHALGTLRTTGIRPRFLDKIALEGIAVDPTMFSFERFGVRR